MKDNMKPTFYFPFTDETNEDNIIILVRDEDEVPLLIWNFFIGESKVGFLHTLFEMEDESGEQQGQGSIIKKIIFNDEFDFSDVKQKIKPNTPVEEYDLLSYVKEQKIVNLFDDEYFTKRVEVLNNLIKSDS